jgi:hypothetical protein
LAWRLVGDSGGSSFRWSQRFLYDDVPWRLIGSPINRKVLEHVQKLSSFQYVSERCCDVSTTSLLVAANSWKPILSANEKSLRYFPDSMICDYWRRKIFGICFCDAAATSATRFDTNRRVRKWLYADVILTWNLMHIICSRFC